jgi:anti-sigma28 factor (negative regulator of flagellin synthesis)
MIDKEKLIKILKQDINHGEIRIDKCDIQNSSCDAIIYHIVKDEIKYIESLIDAIERGDYDIHP